MVFTLVYDDRSEVFGGCVYVSEVVYVEVYKLCVNVVGEVVPVCSVVISVGTIGENSRATGSFLFASNAWKRKS